MQAARAGTQTPQRLLEPAVGAWPQSWANCEKQSERAGNWENTANIFSTLSNTRRFAEMDRFLYFIMKMAVSRPPGPAAVHPVRPAWPLLEGPAVSGTSLGHWRQTPLTSSPGFTLPNRASGRPRWGPDELTALLASETAFLLPAASSFGSGRQRSLLNRHTRESLKLSPKLSRNIHIRKCLVLGARE